LIQMLTRELHPLAHDDGRAPVRVLGEHLWDVRILRSRLGMVTQRPRGFAHAAFPDRERGRCRRDAWRDQTAARRIRCCMRRR